MIGQREEYQVDMDMVMEAAKEKGVVLEINSFPERLDLNDVHCRKAREKGLNLVISTDSHNIRHLDYMLYGVAMAKKGLGRSGAGRQHPALGRAGKDA